MFQVNSPVTNTYHLYQILQQLNLVEPQEDLEQYDVYTATGALTMDDLFSIVLKKKQRFLKTYALCTGGLFRVLLVAQGYGRRMCLRDLFGAWFAAAPNATARGTRVSLPLPCARLCL